MSILAADLGGTRSRVVIADAEGRVLARAESGPGNPVRVGTSRASESLRHAADEALGACGRPGIEAAAVGMAGISHPSSATVVAAALEPLGIQPVVRLLVDDGAIAFRAAFDGPPGVLVMAGTGSGVRAWGERGSFTFGGFGPDIGDPGSAHAVGICALRDAMHADQGQLPRSELTRKVLEHAGASKASLLPDLVRSGQLEPAALHTLVIDAARDADERAVEILRLEGGRLGRLACHAARTAEVPPDSIVATSGSVLREGLLRESLLELLASERPHLKPGAHVDDPVLGAVALARDALSADGSVPPAW